MEKERLTPWYQYRDPLVGILDYIVEVRPPEYDRLLSSYLVGQKKCIEDVKTEDTIAIVHDDDLQLIEDMVSPSQNTAFYIRSQRTRLGNPDCRCNREVLT
jgi:hypothetical protein